MSQECVHHWVLESGYESTDQEVTGVCKLCGKSARFPKIIDYDMRLQQRAKRAMGKTDA